MESKCTHRNDYIAGIAHGDDDLFEFEMSAEDRNVEDNVDHKDNGNELCSRGERIADRDEEESHKRERDYESNDSQRPDFESDALMNKEKDQRRPVDLEQRYSSMFQKGISRSINQRDVAIVQKRVIPIPVSRIIETKEKSLISAV